MESRLLEKSRLIFAAHDGKIEEVMELLEAVSNEKDVLLAWQQFALHIASEQGHAALLERLFKKFPQINLNQLHDHKEMTALHEALEKCHLEVVKFLLRNPETDLGIRRGKRYTQTTLGIAMRPEYLLLKNVFTAEHKEILALFRTPEIGCRSVRDCLAHDDLDAAVQMLNYLYDGGIYPDETIDGIQLLRTCLNLLKNELSPDRFKILCEQLLNTIVTQAASKKTNADNKLIIDLFTWTGISINQLIGEFFKGSLLKHAVTEGNLVLITELFATFSDLDVNDGVSIFCCDCKKKGGVEILRYLLSKGANPAIVSKSGLTPLSNAVIRNDHTSVRILIASKKDLNVNQAYGENQHTAFTQAVVQKDLEMLLLILTIDEVNVNAKFRDDYDNETTALHHVVNRDNHEMAEALLSKKEINVNIRDHHGCSPIFYVRSAQMLNALLKQGASTTITSTQGNVTPFINATAGNDWDCQLIKAFIESKRDLNINNLAIIHNEENTESVTALMAAAMISNEEELALVLSVNGVDVNIQNHAGRTALHFAVSEGKMKNVRLLLARPEINAEVKDTANMTALQIAENIEAKGCYWYSDIISLLKKFKMSLESAKSYLENKDITAAATVLVTFCNKDKNLSIVSNNHLYHLKMAFPQDYEALISQMRIMMKQYYDDSVDTNNLFSTDFSYAGKKSPLLQHTKFSSNSIDAPLEQSMELRTGNVLH